MKKLIYLIAVLFVFSACTKNEIADVEPTDLLEDFQTEFNAPIGNQAKLSTDCNCDYITGIVVSDHPLAPADWVGGQYADLNFDGVIDFADFYIIINLLNDFGEGGNISWPSQVLSGTATYDYNNNGVVGDPNDNIVAMFFTIEMKNVFGKSWQLTYEDANCVLSYILGNLEC